jgi:hypothetical protein
MAAACAARAAVTHLQWQKCSDYYLHRSATAIYANRQTVLCCNEAVLPSVQGRAKSDRCTALFLPPRKPGLTHVWTQWQDGSQGFASACTRWAGSGNSCRRALAATLPPLPDLRRTATGGATVTLTGAAASPPVRHSPCHSVRKPPDCRSRRLQGGHQQLWAMQRL